MIRVPTGDATPASIVDTLKAMAGASSKARACFAKGRCVRGTYIPSDRAEEITKSRSFHRRVTRAGALLGGRRQSQHARHRQSRAARIQLQAWGHRPSFRHSHTERPRSLCEDTGANDGVSEGAHSRARRTARSGETQGVLHCQSRDIASDKLHSRPSASRKLCRYHLLGRPRLSRNESAWRDAIHQIQGRPGRQPGCTDRRRSQDEA